MDYKAIAQQSAEQVLAYNQDLSGWKVVKTSEFTTVPLGHWIIEKTMTKFVETAPLKPPTSHIWLYRIEGVIPELPAHLSDFLYKSEHRVSWDKSLKAFNMIHKIDSDTLICHTITQSFAMGSISPRDFIDLVHIKHQDGNMDIISRSSSLDLTLHLSAVIRLCDMQTYRLPTCVIDPKLSHPISLDSESLGSLRVLWQDNSEARSVEFPGYPPTSHYIRGYNHPSGYVCSPLKENPAYSKLVVFVQTEMKGKLLASVIEKSMPSNLVSFFLNVKDGLKIHKAPIPALRSHHSMHSAVHIKK